MTTCLGESQPDERKASACGDSANLDKCRELAASEFPPVGRPLTRSVIAPAPRGEELPLSFSQEGLWFLQHLRPTSPFYNICEGLWIRNALDVGLLWSCCERVAKRHEILRTAFPAIGGRLFQQIGRGVPCRRSVVELSALPPAVRSRELERLAIDEASRPFDLARGPLFRHLLARLGSDHHLLLMTAHHIICDPRSVGLIMREVMAFYTAARAGVPSPLRVPVIQFADFACWQRQRLRDDLLRKQLAYWRARLADAPAYLELPTDRPRPLVQTFRGALCPLRLGGSLSDAIRALSREGGVTVLVTLAAAFSCLLRTYSQHKTLLQGLAISDRKRPETEALVGYLVRVLVLRTDFVADPTFSRLQGEVREAVTGAARDQDLPLKYLINELQPLRSLSHTPLFQVALSMQSSDLPSGHVAGLRLAPFEVHNRTSKMDLTLLLRDGPEGFTGGFEYSTDLFDATTLKRLRRHFEVLLEGIVRWPDRRISRLPLSPRAERHQLLVEWSEFGLAAGENEKRTVERRFGTQFGTRVEAEPGSSAIGRPIREVRTSVLGVGGRMRPIGAAGELCLGGVGWAQGDRHRPRLTADRFRPDPFTGKGSRCFRTGDRARFRPDGAIEVLGRLDQQVKIQGFRIEPRLIEEALEQHPGILRAAVVARQTSGEPVTSRRGREAAVVDPEATLEGRLVGQVLTAYVEAGKEPVPDSGELRMLLAERLHRHMVPTHFVTLASLPTTPQGDLDRSALSSSQHKDKAKTLVIPSTHIERTIAGIWHDVLEIPTVGLHDNFFELGGSSLSINRIRARLGEVLEISIPLVKFFEHPTIAGLARYLDESRAPAREAGSVPKRVAARKRALLGRRRQRNRNPRTEA